MINYTTSSNTFDSDYSVSQGKREKVANDFENKFDIYHCEYEGKYYIECVENADPDFRRLLSTLCDSDNDSQWMWSSGVSTTTTTTTPVVYGNTQSNRTSTCTTTASAGTYTMPIESYTYCFNSQEKLIAAINYLKDVADINFSLEVEMLMSSSIKKIKGETE